MKKLLLIAVVLAAAYFGIAQLGGVTTTNTAEVASGTNSNKPLVDAITNHQSNVQVQGGGIVVKILTDDREGSKHQRFIVRLESGQTILIAHNIDLANKIDSLKEGGRVEFKGEYEWNQKGGVVHWTHRDPNGHHSTGWIKHNGQIFQ